ncbi:MAG: hypothetical protein EBT48_07205 [Verrucomicrobia bacterium]|nr:hypothetical protein [Verrucomicrobiota bacterium]
MANMWQLNSFLSCFNLIIYMPKELKYKRGFTLRHHLDEKWDRLDYNFKLKIKAFFFIFIIGGFVLGLAWASQKYEKTLLMKEGATRSDTTQEKVLMSTSRNVSPPPLRHAED